MNQFRVLALAMSGPTDLIKEVKKMSLPIVLIVVVTIMGIFAFSIILLARKNNVSLKQTVDSKPIHAYKNGEQKLK